MIQYNKFTSRVGILYKYHCEYDSNSKMVFPRTSKSNSAIFSRMKTFLLFCRDSFTLVYHSLPAKQNSIIRGLIQDSSDIKIKCLFNLLTSFIKMSRLNNLLLTSCLQVQRLMQR